MKKVTTGIFFLFICLSILAQTKVYISEHIETRDGKQYYIHTVQQGQTVYSIAKAYEVSVDEIYYENPLASDGISIDEELWIPTVNKESELSQELRARNFDYFYHLAKENQTYAQLSAIYKVPEIEIKKANPGLVSPFRKGEYIKIPVNQGIQNNNDEDISFDPNINVIPDFRHTVKAGETQYSIAKYYHVTVEQLRAVNPTMTSEIEIGDRLRIPQTTEVQINDIEDNKVLENEPQQPESYTHTVKKGETLYSITRSYGVTQKELIAANPGLSETLSIGQVIQVPRTNIDKPFIVYVPDRRTKLSKIAKLYNVTTGSLERLNPSLESKVFAGQRVKIPVGKMALEQLEEKEKVPEIKPKEVVIVETPDKPIGCKNIKPEYNKVFKVALLMPFYLEETDSLDMKKFLAQPQNSFMPFRFIQFYEGALLAIDSLRTLGFNVKLFVYDVDQSITKTAKVLQKPELRSMDLIIGPFHSYSFDQVALFAGNFNIPIVNPLSYRDEITQKYKTTIKVKSATHYQADLVPPLIPEYYSGDKVFLITHTAYQDADIVTNLANEISVKIKPDQKVSNNELYNLIVAVANRDKEFEEGDPLPKIKFEGVKINPDVIQAAIDDSTLFSNPLIRINYIKDSLHPFLNQASALRGNLVIIYGDSKAFVMDAMNRLNEYRDTFNIQLIAMPSIEKIDDIDHIQSNNLHLTYFSTSYLDYHSPDVKNYILKFRKYYHTEPDVYGFTGFDITYYFVYALTHLDLRFQTCLQHVPLDMMLGRYQFKKTGLDESFENTYWNLVRYYNLEEVKLPDPVLIKGQE